MNRLALKQKASISAFQSGAPRPRRARHSHLSSCVANESLLPISRKAFASDRALGDLVDANQRSNNKAATGNPRSLLTEQGFMLHLTINACDVTELRRRVIGNCGDLVLFMRIQPLLQARKMRVWILLGRQEFDFVIRIIKSGLPDAEIEQSAHM
jgi:hypothetical protein